MASTSAFSTPDRVGHSRAREVAATLVSFGTNKLVRRGASWLKRNGLVKYVLPLLVVNEGLGAYRVYAAGSAFNWW